MRCHILLSLLVVATMADFVEPGPSAKSTFDYCTINSKCDGATHTLCTYKSDTPGKKCKNYVDHLLKPKEKQALLDKHNELRRFLQNGNVPNHRAAKVMPALTWSLELEQIARRWAMQCMMKHDKCRRTKLGEYVGQNLASAWSSAGFEGKELEGVQGWFDEHTKYTPNEKNLYPKGVSGVGHYTQMVWAETLYLGCERSFDETQELLVCVYLPGGNMQDSPVYEPLAAGQTGVLGSASPPRDGETGVPEETVLISGAPTVKQQNFITVLLVCLSTALCSAIFPEVF